MKNKTTTNQKNNNGARFQREGFPPSKPDLSSCLSPRPLQVQADSFFENAGYTKIDDGFFNQPDYEAVKSDKSDTYKLVFCIYAKGRSGNDAKTIALATDDPIRDASFYRQLHGWHIFYLDKQDEWIPSRYLSNGDK